MLSNYMIIRDGGDVKYINPRCHQNKILIVCKYFIRFILVLNLFFKITYAHMSQLLFYATS